MAEFIGVVGLTASIVQLLDTGKRVADRIREFQNNLAFAHLNTKLPVLNLTLTRIKEAQEHEPFDNQTQEALLGAVNECQSLTTQLDALITRMSPAEEDSKLRRAFKGIRSFGKDKRLLEIQAKLDTAIDQLANYLAVDASLTSRSNAQKHVETSIPLLEPTATADKTIFDVPAQHVSLFVGRKALMEKIEANFAKADPDSVGPNVVVLIGMGGQGKSQLALKHCRKHRPDHQAVIWVDASSAQAAANSFDKIASILEKRGFVNYALSKKDFVKDHLDAMETPWLLIFDNYDNPGAFADIKSYFPSGKGSIIVTSRHAESKRLGYPIPVDSLSEDEAVELLLQKSGTEDTEANRFEARKIVKRLAYLALAVDQAAAFISLRHLPITQFLERYDQRKEALMKYVPNSPLWEYRRCLDDAEKETSLSVFTTWEMSFRQIAEIDKGQDAIGHFLTLSSYFNPAKISEFIYSECSAEAFLAGSIPDWLKVFYREGVWDEDCFQEVVSGLANLSLIRHYEIEIGREYQSSWFTLHPLIRDWLQLRLSAKEQREYSWEALEVLQATEATTVGSFRFGSYLIRDELYLHLQSLLKYNEMDGLPSFDIPETHLPLLHELAVFVATGNGPFAFAEALLLKITVYVAQYFGQHSTPASRYKTLLARFYTSSGLYDRAIEILQDEDDSLVIETNFPNGDIVANLRYLLAECYEEKGDFTQAKGLYLRALATTTQSKPSILLRLAGIYKHLEDFSKAETFLEQYLEIWDQEPGVRDPLMLHAIITLGETYYKVGKIEEAEAMFLRASDTYPKHPHTSKPCYWDWNFCTRLGNFYADTGRPLKAKDWLLEALKLGKITYNPAKPQDAFWIYIITNQVGIACLKAGHLLEAKSYCLEAKSGFERLDDPRSEEWIHTLTHNLAVINEKFDALDEPAQLSNEA